MKIIEPVAIFHSPFSSKFGIPRQSGLIDELTGRIVLEPKFRNPNALRGLSDFDYLWLIWGFSANEPKENQSINTQHSTLHTPHSTINSPFHPTVRPPRLGGNERIGVFASRSPFRPNGLGLSSVKLIDIEKTDIIVGGADLMDGTPIYDIKPYLPYVDAHTEARGGFTDQRQWQKLDVVIPHSIRQRLSDKQASELSNVLSLDPRPHYQNDPNRIYGMPFGGHDVRFKVEGNILTIVEII